MFKLTDKQIEANAILASESTNICLFGGSRSGKTFLLVRNIILRALKAPNSRHAIFRFRLNAIKATILADTLPKVMKIVYPDVKYNINKTDGIIKFDNGSEIILGGLDDAQRTEKILGMEFVTIYLNEASQIPLASYNIVMTRLAQKCYQIIDGKEILLTPRLYVDCNPPNKSHWVYRLFVLKIDPESKQKLNSPDDYKSFRINPHDNTANLSSTYLDMLGNMSLLIKKRFLFGEFSDDNPNALFNYTNIEENRIKDGLLPDLVRIVVSVDPNGANDTNKKSDEAGIVVVGLGQDGIAYLLEDLTIAAGVDVWSKLVSDTYERYEADIVVAEVNYGGAMVEQVIRTHNPRISFKALTSTRGKHIRAEPVSVLYEQGKVRHMGDFTLLEDELCAFSNTGYTGDKSPNRADALVFAIQELFNGIVNPRNKNKGSNSSGIVYKKRSGIK